MKQKEYKSKMKKKKYGLPDKAIGEREKGFGRFWNNLSRSNVYVLNGGF